MLSNVQTRVLLFSMCCAYADCVLFLMCSYKHTGVFRHSAEVLDICILHA